MPTLDADSLTNIISDTVADIDAENIIDAAINRIAANGYEIHNLSGTAGSKSCAVSKAELGWIQTVALSIYAQWKTSGSSSDSYSMGLISQSESSSSSSALGSPDDLAQKAANQLIKTDTSWGRAII
jgi:hypothetical protein